MFKDKTILLGVTGGIAAYKAASLCSQMVQRGANVHVVMTKNAQRFINPITFQALSQHEVMCDTFQEEDPAYISHIHYADKADLIVVAPATAQTIAKVSQGIADNMLTNVLLATSDLNKILLCPAMNVNMLHNPFTKENFERIERVGISILKPAEGHLACGYEAEGKLPDTRTIVSACEQILSNRVGK
ncbi:flavoprotein [Brevibacillus sp. NPDC058079]|uniref:flavoprotein n=1 Tax=Brevibacillus sp. NPDC058079 TaxID=3346330 RepID=UPI0036E1FF3D